MRYGLSVATFGALSDPRTMVRLAVDAEAAGWDGFFVWDHVHWSGEADGESAQPLADPTIVLAAVAAATSSIRIGPLVTPLARRRPWKVAREFATLDHLTGGRVTLGVGLGAPAGLEFGAFGEDTGPRHRAELLDESLDILHGLWSGEAFTYRGRHHHVTAARMIPTPVQTPIPVWVAGEWPVSRAPFRRAARFAGVYPLMWSVPAARQVAEIAGLVSFMQELTHPRSDLDVVYGVETAAAHPEEGRDTAGRFAEAGVTWWMEPITDWRGSLAELRARIDAGPPI